MQGKLCPQWKMMRLNEVFITLGSEKKREKESLWNPQVGGACSAQVTATEQRHNVCECEEGEVQCSISPSDYSVTFSSDVRKRVARCYIRRRGATAC